MDKVARRGDEHCDMGGGAGAPTIPTGVAPLPHPAPPPAPPPAAPPTPAASESHTRTDANPHAPAGRPHLQRYAGTIDPHSGPYRGRDSGIGRHSPPNGQVNKRD